MVMFLGLFVDDAFADIPFEDPDWKFKFVDVEIYQNPQDLEILLIEVPVKNTGLKGPGSVMVYATVTDPTGSHHTHMGYVGEVEIGDTDSVMFKHKMWHDGKYVVNISMTPPNDDHKDHVFDIHNDSITIPENGLMLNLGTLAQDRGTVISYMVENPELVDIDNMVRAEISLPTVHNYEKIVITNNGEIKKEFDISESTLLLNSKSDTWSDMRVMLVEKGNALPLVGAQNPIIGYVSFYMVDVDQCINTFCLDIDVDVMEDQPPYWMLGFLGLGAIIPFILNKNNKDKDPWRNEFSEKR